MDFMYKMTNKILEQLRNFNGSENFYKDNFNGCIYTDGFKKFMELTGTHWLFSDTAILLMMKYLNKEDFVVVKIKVNEDKSCMVILDNGNGIEFYKKKYSYTDFPLKEFEFWAVYNELDSYTFMLKSEY